MKIKNQKSTPHLSTAKRRFVAKRCGVNFGLSFCILIFAFCILFSGCEAFVRKFTRKPKEPQVKEEVVFLPEDYSLSDMPVEERYRQYFVFWQSWQDELIEAFESSVSQKRRISCLEEAIKNLGNLKPLLVEEKQKGLDAYIQRLLQIKDEITKDIYAQNLSTYKARLEVLKREILRDYSYSKVKRFLR